MASASSGSGSGTPNTGCNILVGCVGKPNAGKSSFLNACTDANAKVGNYSFTTINPNVGVAHCPVACPCAKYGKSSLCKPRYGSCKDGRRLVPVRMLDVAGLIPGASEGLGLGNKFLDDLRNADLLLHVIDASGTTNAKGEATTGYDPVNDVEWLRAEIHAWIFHNLWKRWGNIVRKHTAAKLTALVTIHTQLSGYKTKPLLVQLVLDKLGVKEPSDIHLWKEDEVHRLVDTFMDFRFPTILVANKCDMPGADLNIARLCDRFGEENVVPCSALAETFLRKMAQQKYIAYQPGSDNFQMAADDPDAGLKEPDAKVARRLENIRDLVLYRFNGTGVQSAIERAIERVGLIPVFPVANLNNFSNGKSDKVFRDCFLVKKGTTIRELAYIVHPEIERHLAGAEDVQGLRLSEADPVLESNNIIKFHTHAFVEEQPSSSSSSSSSKDKDKDKKKDKDRDTSSKAGDPA